MSERTVEQGELRTWYPEIEPHETGLLDVGDGHRVYYEVSGNPDGKPAVYLHGGPGGGSSPDQRRVFDPDRYRIVLFDQRGCGRSTPHAGDPASDLSTNTTWHLVADMERLRAHLGIDTWLVCGGSWGSTLALAYAQTHVDRVDALVLRGIFTLRQRELDWFYEGGAATVFPDRWQELLGPVPPDERGRVVEAYDRLLHDPDETVRRRAARAWSRWEMSTVTLVPDERLLAQVDDDRFALDFARIENHYFRHGGWLREGQLLADAHRLADVPGVIVQGRYDMCTPMMTAWELHQAWPSSTLRIVEDAGHVVSEPGILDAVIEATDGFVA